MFEGEEIEVRLTDRKHRVLVNILYKETLKKKQRKHQKTEKDAKRDIEETKNKTNETKRSIRDAGRGNTLK